MHINQNKYCIPLTIITESSTLDVGRGIEVASDKPKEKLFKFSKSCYLGLQIKTVT